MAYTYEIPNMTSGIDEALVDIAATNTSFIPMLLVFIFGVVFIGGVTSQKRRTGYADIPMWATISSLATLMTALPMTLISGLIPLETLVIVVVITIFSGLWLFMGRGRGEV